MISPENREKTTELFKDAQFEPDYITVTDPDRETVKKDYAVKREDGSIIPSVFLIDKENTLRFKYIAQYTSDRPPKEHLIEAIKMIRE